MLIFGSFFSLAASANSVQDLDTFARGGALGPYLPFQTTGCIWLLEKIGIHIYLPVKIMSFFLLLEMEVSILVSSED